MKTFRITENEIKDMKPVAVGYKIFSNDWTAKSNGYDYKDENGNVLNTIHKVDGDINECSWGLHFSKSPQDSFEFYESVQWKKFAKVEAYDQLIIRGKKCVTNILKIVEIYTFDEFINLIQKDLQNNKPNGVSYSNSVSESNGVEASRDVHMSNGVNMSYGVNYSTGVSWSDGVNRSNGVNLSNGVHGTTGVHKSDGMYMSSGVSYSNGVSVSKGVSESKGVSLSDGVNGSNGVNESNGVSWSNGVCASNGVNRSNGVNWSYGVDRSYGVYGAEGVDRSFGVDASNGVNESNGVSSSNGVCASNGVNRSYGILECEGISRAIFCYKKSGKLMAFNKRITEERFNEIFDELNSFGWYPKFNNAEQLKGDLEWYETNIPAIKSVDNKTAWSSMPKEMLEYIKSLPEYDEQIFNKITGGEL